MSFDVTNAGARAGTDTPQVYLINAHGQPMLRLIGWQRIMGKPGETRRVTITADPRLLADFDARAHRWKLGGGIYQIAVGASSADFRLTGEVRISARWLKP